jgi:hypothetical protein
MSTGSIVFSRLFGMILLDCCRGAFFVASALTWFLGSMEVRLVMALNLAMFLNDPKTNLAWGATAGFLAGFGWVAMEIAIVSLFERRTWSYVLVNGGYMTVALVVMGAILGGWR